MSTPTPQNDLSAAEVPGAMERGISLYQSGAYAEARSLLQAVVAREPTNSMAWNALGYLNRDIGETHAAADAFERALALRSDDPIAVKGRARLAFERGEDDVRARYAAALAMSPGDPRLALELTEARLGEGDAAAVQEFGRLVVQYPQWTEGQVALARMLWETQRSASFADHIRVLLRQQPRRSDLWKEFVVLLSGCGQYEAAADAARAARGAVDGGTEFALMEAVTAGQGGDVARAEALWSTMPVNVPGRAGHQSVHFLRQGKLDLARGAIEKALAEKPDEIGWWAVAELIYRKLADPRSAWLSGQPGLVRVLDLPIDARRFHDLRDLLLRLHARSPQMIGQSVRDGTQTRGRLFDRIEPELAILRETLEAALADYVAKLPPRDLSHPLLRHREAALTITGSWSVRLTGSGHHVSHMHPQGLISSAAYIAVPELSPHTDEGRLVLGVPSPDLFLDIAPLHVIRPKPGQLVLFPSYLHHGTRPFSAGERLTVAFDVNRHPAPLL